MAHVWQLMRAELARMFFFSSEVLPSLRGMCCPLDKTTRARKSAALLQSALARMD